MKITIDAYDMEKIFTDWNRNYYTHEGYECLLDYYNEIDENMELDVIAICIECTEYGDGVSNSLNDLRYDFRHIYSVEEYLEDSGIDKEDFDIDEYTRELISCIEDSRMVLYVSNGNYIIFDY